MKSSKVPIMWKWPKLPSDSFIENWEVSGRKDEIVLALKSLVYHFYINSSSSAFSTVARFYEKMPKDKLLRTERRFVV